MPDKPTVSVLTGDPHPLYRDAVARVVRQHAGFQIVAEVEDGDRALSEIMRLRPDVAVLELSMPSLTGDRILAAVRREKVPTRVLFLTGSISPATAYQALADGAAGCLTKVTHADELRRAIASAARGDVVLGSGVPASLAQEIQLRHDADRPVLTARERTILDRLADGRCAPQIARELHLAPTTVKSHLSRLYDKLGVNDRAAAVATGMRRGLLE